MRLHEKLYGWCLREVKSIGRPTLKAMRVISTWHKYIYLSGLRVCLPNMGIASQSSRLNQFWKGLCRHTWIASKHCNLDWNKEDAADVLGGIDDKTLVWPYSI
jgi:hypothetical protein